MGGLEDPIDLAYSWVGLGTVELGTPSPREHLAVFHDSRVALDTTDVIPPN